MREDMGAGAVTTAEGVSRLLPRLAPTAALLTETPADAVRLLGAALGRRHALGSSGAALRELGRAAGRRPRWVGEQVVGQLSPASPTDADVVLADALRTLPARDRTAVVLSLVAGLPAAEVAADLPGTPAAGATAAVARLLAVVQLGDEAERRARVREQAPFRVAGSDHSPVEDVVALPERLARLAAGRPLPAGAAETIAAAVATTRQARRRRVLRVAAGTVGVAVLAVLAPLLPTGAPTPSAASVYARATAGSLATDEVFLRGLGQLDWPPARTADTRRVVFAGDVPGGRWALLATGGSRSRPTAIGWFVGAAGASPGSMRLLAGRSGPDPAEPVSLTDPATGALVVIGAPDDRISMSERPEVRADGSIDRVFSAVPAERGVAVLDLPPLPGSPGSAVRFEVLRSGDRLDASPPLVVPGAPALPDAVPGSRLRPAPTPAVGDAAVAPRLAAVLGELGQPATTAEVTTLWAGDLPGPNDQPTRLTIIAVQQPSGAVVVTAPYGYAADLSGRGGSSWCGTGVLPAGEPLAQRVVAVRCDLSDFRATRELSRFLVVVAPPGATTVQLLDGSRAVLSERPLTDGVAVVRSPGDVDEVVVTRAGGGSSPAPVLVADDLGG